MYTYADAYGIERTVTGEEYEKSNEEKIRRVIHSLDYLVEIGELDRDEASLAKSALCSTFDY